MAVKRAHVSEMRVAEADFKIRWRGTRMDHDLRGERRIFMSCPHDGTSQNSPYEGVAACESFASEQSFA